MFRRPADGLIAGVNNFLKDEVDVHLALNRYGRKVLLAREPLSSAESEIDHERIKIMLPSRLLDTSTDSDSVKTKEELLKEL